MFEKLFGRDTENDFAELATDKVREAIACYDAAVADLAEQEAVRNRLQASFDRLREALAQCKATLRPLDPRSRAPIVDPARVAAIAAGEDTTHLDARDAELRTRIEQLQIDSAVAGRLLREHSMQQIGDRPAGPLPAAQRALADATTSLVSRLRDAARAAELPPMLVEVAGVSHSIGVPRTVALGDLLATLRSE